MKVYALLHGISYEGSYLLGIYQYLSQAQEAEYAWRQEQLKEAEYLYADCSAWTEIQELTLGAAPKWETGVAVAA